MGLSRYLRNTVCLSPLLSYYYWDHSSISLSELQPQVLVVANAF
jgi:hypothetical protein